MKQIQVTAETLLHLRESLDSTEPGGPYRLVCRYGFPGFAGGLDHLVDRPWSFDIIDRGLSTGSGYRDNSTRFIVPMAQRIGRPPLRDYCNPSSGE